MLMEWCSKQTQLIPVFLVGLHRVGSALCADMKPKYKVEDPLCIDVEQDSSSASVGMPQALQICLPFFLKWCLNESKRFQSFASGCIELGAPAALM